MDLLFAMHRKHIKCSPPSMESLNGGPTLCVVSTANIIAFTSLTELSDTSGASWGCHVYVCDVNSPWNSFKVASFRNQVSALEWDTAGKYILVADCMGDINVYAPREYLLNDWTCIYNASLPGEHIIKAAFFHNGRKIVISSDKKLDQLPCTEKFQQVRFSPSVQYFGHTAAEGCIVITSTGLVAAMLLPSELAQTQPIPAGNPQQPAQLQLAVETLLATRDHITTADICYGKSGHFLIAVSSGSAVRCYRASVHRQTNPTNSNNPPLLSCQPLPSFFPRETASRDGLGTGVVWSVSCLRWTSKEDADALAISLSPTQSLSGQPIEGDTLLQLWGLVEKALPVHALFLSKGSSVPITTGQKQSAECFNTVMWQYQCQFRVSNSRVWWMCVSRCVHTSTQLLVLASTNNQLHCLQSDTLKLIYTSTVSPFWSSANGGLGPAINECSISCADVTSLSAGLVVVDSSSNLYLFKLPQPATDSSSAASILHATTLLEYSIVTGFDALDVMMMLKPPVLEAVYERLTESFLRQTRSWKQYHKLRWLCTRAALSRLSPLSQARASELTCLLMLNSILAAFKSLLRPAELTSLDKGPAENLAAVVRDLTNPPVDIDKALMHIEAKEFAAEPVALQSARRLIQWTAELALASLAAVPHSSFFTSSGRSNYNIVRDPSAVGTLRQLLVVARVWGLQRPHCLPVFATMPGGADVLAQLYHLLTRLAHQRCEPDDTFKYDCTQLSLQMLIPQMWESLPRTGVATPQSHHLPLHLEYGVEPEKLKYSPEVPQLEGSITSDCCMDSIRHMYLGLRPGSMKRCGRCGSASAPTAPPRTAAQRAWDQRFFQHCRCGGWWNLEVNT